MDDLKLIKKYYGENMMHLCRELFPTLLETPGLLFNLFDSSFEHSKFLYADIVNFGKIEELKNCINGFIIDKEELLIREETPFELLKEAGYNLYECKTEEDIQRFKKYYQADEQLCTFNGNRLNRCHVFFAVKENVTEIRREDFREPKREDEYGTSVISIQFSRGDVNGLSIKNRYNNAVENPDATFFNNLDNIIPGLTKSFERAYNLNIIKTGSIMTLPKIYTKASNGKAYRFNYCVNKVFYCPNNIIIDNGEVKQLEKEKYILVDYFIIDLVNKKIGFYGFVRGESFLDNLKDIKKISVEKDKNTSNKNIFITSNEGNKIIIQINEFNQIVGYENNNAKKIDDNFLWLNNTLKWIRMLSVTEVGNSCLTKNKDLLSLEMPKLERIGSYFLSDNESLESLLLPSVMEIEAYSLYNNKILNNFYAPNLEIMGNCVLKSNISLRILDLPSIKEIGSSCFEDNLNFEIINFPNLEQFSYGGIYSSINKLLLKQFNKNKKSKELVKELKKAN